MGSMLMSLSDLAERWFLEDQLKDYEQVMVSNELLLVLPERGNDRTLPLTSGNSEKTVNFLTIS